MFTKNVGTFDRYTRLMISAGLIIWLVSSAPIFGISIVTAIIVLSAFANAIIGLFSVCIVYSPFNFSTSQNKN